MANYQILFSKESLRDSQKLAPKMKKKLEEILVNQVAKYPYAGKKLQGNLQGLYSVRLSYQDRIIYSINERNKTVHIHQTRRHYDD